MNVATYVLLFTYRKRVVAVQSFLSWNARAEIPSQITRCSLHPTPKARSVIRKVGVQKRTIDLQLKFLCSQVRAVRRTTSEYIGEPKLWRAERFVNNFPSITWKLYWLFTYVAGDHILRICLVCFPKSWLLCQKFIAQCGKNISTKYLRFQIDEGTP